MTSAPATTNILPAEASQFLLDLAAGKYDSEVAKIQAILGKAAAVWPPFAAISQAISVFIWVNKATAPHGGVIPDGQGGFVPADNSTFDSTTGQFTEPNALGF